MRRETKCDISSLKEILKGVQAITEPVKSTLGVGGNTVLIGRKIDTQQGLAEYPILVTKDGYTVTEHFELDDSTQKIGVKMVKEAAQKTVDQAGDGTTSTCLFLEAILTKGAELVEGGANPQQLKKGIDTAVKYIVEQLKKQSIKVDGDIEKIRQVATLSANGDTVIGNLIADAYKQIGMQGVITVDEAKGVNTSLKITNGFKLNRGWISPYFVTDVTKGECELIEPYIFVYQQPISQLKSILPLLKLVEPTRKPILIICEDCDSDALATLIRNKGTLNSCVVSTSYLGEKRNEIMEDLAKATGANFLSDIKGIKIENVLLAHLGTAKKVVIGQNETLIVGGGKKEQDYNNFVSDLGKLLASTEDENEKKYIQQRIATLNGNVAILSVGAATEVEMKEMKDRADDAVGSAKCAIEEGYVAGGGTALLKIEPLIEVTTNRNEDYRKGQELIFDILKVSLEQICINAGVKFSDVYLKVISEGQNIGYNAATEQVEDLIKSGIIDATKVVRCSLQNAASVATMILISKCSIAYTY